MKMETESDDEDWSNDDEDWSNEDDEDDLSAEETLEFDDRNVNWRTSGAREIILDDLYRGVLTIDEEILPAEQAWEIYSKVDGFQLVPFAQFKRQLKAHRNQVLKMQKESLHQYESFRRDQATQQQFTTYEDGRPIFVASPAHALLREDVKELYQTKISVGQLQVSRPEFESWTRAEFKRRVYQEVRYWKFVAYMEEKRQKLLTRETKKVDAKKRKVDTL